MVLKGKPVGLIPEVLDQLERGRPLVQVERKLVTGIVDFFQPLCNANDGNLAPQADGF